MQPVSEINDEFGDKILLYDYDDRTTKLLAATNFNDWSILNDSFKADEIYFAQEDRIEILAMPYDDHIYFYSPSAELLSAVENANPKFKNSIYTKD